MRNPWLLGLSIAAHQIVFTSLVLAEVRFMYVSAWVLRAPVGILWAVYLAAPFIHVRPIAKPSLIRSYALSGWLYVGAAIAWSICYIIFSERFGTPVSWDAVKQHLQ